MIPSKKTTGIDPHDLAKLLLEHSMELLKTHNTNKNVGKTPALVLAEALNKHYNINVWPTPETVHFSECPDRGRCGKGHNPCQFPECMPPGWDKEED